MISCLFLVPGIQLLCTHIMPSFQLVRVLARTRSILCQWVSSEGQQSRFSEGFDYRNEPRPEGM
jgi:hypothetical protein